MTTYPVTSFRGFIIGTVVGFVLLSVLLGTVTIAFRYGVHDGKIVEWTLFKALTNGTHLLWDVTTNYPLLILFFTSVVGFILLLTVVSNIRSSHVRDPQRAFNRNQRTQGADRAEGQCELEQLWWFRCRRPGEHGDHFFPWSKGGASNMTNFVWACAKCNLSKSNIIPTYWLKIRIERRRQKYFPPTVPVECGQKYRQH